MARRLTGPLALLLPAMLAACAADPPADAPTTSEDPLPASVDSARDQLTALATAARDRHFTARYTLTGSAGPERTILVTTANDGTWRVDVPAGAGGGTIDVSLAATADGLFQCALPSAGHPEAAGCVRLGDRDDRVPGRYDPRVQHPFTDWPAVLNDGRAPLAVSATPAPHGVDGTCFAVDSTSASLDAPLDVGTYCYGPDGTLTALHSALGTLRLAGPPGPAPDTVTLAGPVVDRSPWQTTSPAPEPTESAPEPAESGPEPTATP
ncbi:hypothetical protein [Micromonospora sp. PLK6-60]|uniref:hypothetical protein n=1 Tax=Micromonospora sp. PLK6-60 TaxID=2873383 RepID=UPI0027DF4636|nr:hypothetical protein [Micromonospora sp. PLK6-60]